MTPAIYFTTVPRSECTCDRLPSENHATLCPRRCGHVASVDRFGTPNGTFRPITELHCFGDYDHEGDHRGVSRIGGHSVWWSDEETAHVLPAMVD